MKDPREGGVPCATYGELRRNIRPGDLVLNLPVLPVLPAIGRRTSTFAYLVLAVLVHGEGDALRVRCVTLSSVWNARNREPRWVLEHHASVVSIWALEGAWRTRVIRPPAGGEGDDP